MAPEGELVGCTRFQKVAYLLELAGLGAGIWFHYRPYGPYSEELEVAINEARVVGLVTEEELPTTWGGVCSVYRTTPRAGAQNEERAPFVATAAQIGSIELELMSTAAYLRVVEEHPDPWVETERRKPEKARDGRLDRARRAYQELREIPLPIPLPDLE